MKTVFAGIILAALSGFGLPMPAGAADVCRNWQNEEIACGECPFGSSGEKNARGPVCVEMGLRLSHSIIEMIKAPGYARMDSAHYLSSQLLYFNMKASLQSWYRAVGDDGVAFSVLLDELRADLKDIKRLIDEQGALIDSSLD